MVRMAQDFSMRLPLISGQGNFGSMDGDPPAAMRYTEARLATVAETLLADIDKDTVEFQPNYDEREQEPTVLPAAYPEPAGQRRGRHRRRHGDQHPAAQSRRADRRLLRADRQSRAHRSSSCMEYVPGPDFPTGGTILGRNGIRAGYELGRGSLIMRGARPGSRRARGGRESIIVSEIPYQENKARLHERIAEVVRDKRVEGISEVRDESDRDGVRLVIELKRDAMADVVLNQLYRFTPLQTIVRRQRAGARRRPAAADEPQGAARGVHPLPRRGHHAAHQVRAQPRPRPRPCAGRSRHRRRQHRRSDRDDPPRARSRSWRASA